MALEVPRMDPGVIHMVLVAPHMALMPPPIPSLEVPLMEPGVIHMDQGVLLMDLGVLHKDPQILVPTAKLARGQQM